MTIEELECSYPLLLFGHNVSEGTISLFPNHDIGLQTTLRDPMKRMISHYNMVKSVGNFKGFSNDFIKSRGNFICRWFLEKFPSLTNDAFAPLHIQALSILEYFEDILILENSDIEFSYFMSKMNCNYDHHQRTNVKFYKKQKIVHEDESVLNSYISEDILLYDAIKKVKRTNRTALPLPKLRRPHFWFRRFLMAYIQAPANLRQDMLQTVKDHNLYDLISLLDTDCKITSHILFKWINNLEIDNLSTSELSNIIDVTDKLIKFNDKSISFINEKANNTLADILKESFQHSQVMSQFGSSAWEHLPSKLAYRSKGLGSYYSNTKDLEKKISNLEHALFTFKTDTFILKELGQAYSEINNTDKAYLCAKKLIELKGSHTWADSYLSNL